MSMVKVRKNIIISHNFDDDPPGEFSTYINIQFVPDEVIVRSIVYIAPAPEDTISYLYTDLVDDNFLGIVCDGLEIATQQVFTIKKSISGNYNFKLLLLNGTLNAEATGDLLITLEFIKYK